VHFGVEAATIFGRLIESLFFRTQFGRNIVHYTPFLILNCGESSGPADGNGGLDKMAAQRPNFGLLHLIGDLLAEPDPVIGEAVLAELFEPCEGLGVFTCGKITADFDE
jgi:hypothetical protein